MVEISKDKGIDIFLYPTYNPNELEISNTKRIMVIVG